MYFEDALYPSQHDFEPSSSTNIKMSHFSTPQRCFGFGPCRLQQRWLLRLYHSKIVHELSDTELADAMMNVDDEAVIVPVPAGTNKSGWKKLALADLPPAGQQRNRKPAVDAPFSEDADFRAQAHLR